MKTNLSQRSPISQRDHNNHNNHNYQNNQTFNKSSKYKCNSLINNKDNNINNKDNNINNKDNNINNNSIVLHPRNTPPMEFHIHSNDNEEIEGGGCRFTDLCVEDKGN